MILGPVPRERPRDPSGSRVPSACPGRLSADRQHAVTAAAASASAPAPVPAPLCPASLSSLPLSLPLSLALFPPSLSLSLFRCMRIGALSSPRSTVQGVLLRALVRCSGTSGTAKPACLTSTRDSATRLPVITGPQKGNLKKGNAQKVTFKSLKQ